MKKMIFMLTMLLAVAVESNAMSYEQARQQALFLADKMAYELNLNEEQYEACYEINLDYLMGVTSERDLYGEYWTRRNLDMSYILLDWQYRAFVEASYFYRPLYWNAGYWHFGIYARYPHREYFYFGRPTFWGTYRGGHAWGHNGGHSWYHGRDFGHGSHRHDTKPAPGHTGMRDDFNRGNYGRGTGYSNRNSVTPRDNRQGGTTREFEPSRQSSTRSTARDRSTMNNTNRQSTRNSATQSTQPSQPTRSTTTQSGRSGQQSSRGGMSQGSSSRSMSQGSSSRSMGSQSSQGSSRSQGSQSSGQRGGRR